MTIPKEYLLAISMLDAVYKHKPLDTVDIILGDMRINGADGMPMDPASLQRWNRIATKSDAADEVELLIRYLEYDASIYKTPPDDLKHLIAALKKPGTPERLIVEKDLSLNRS